MPVFRGGAANVKELVAVLVRQHGIVKVHAGDARNETQHDVFQARLSRGGNGDGIAVATKPGRDPHDVQLVERS